MAIDTTDELREAYMDFFKNYQTDDGEFKYINRINRMIRDGIRSITVDYEDLVLMFDEYDLDLASTVTDKPAFAIEVGSEALGDQVRIENQDYHRDVVYDKDIFSVRFNNLPTPIPIRELRAKHVDSIKWMEGIIIRTTEIRSIITEAVYYCTEGHENKIMFQDGIYAKPESCHLEICRAKDFNLDPQESKMIDWQFITLQEKPENLPPGASPKSLACRLLDDLVNSVRPGDRIQLGGIIRSRPTKLMKRGQVLTYDIWIDVNFVISLTKDDEYTRITPEEEKYFIDLSQDPKVHERLMESIAPAIMGRENIKEAGLYVLFGGVDKSFPDGFTTRGQSNILLVGDPGTGKSQILRYMQSIAPRGLYTSGKGASAAGLTAAIIRDPDTGEITLEAGALVLADRGLCLIDEFDKMNENDRSAIHESMEQHSYHPMTEIRFASGRVSEIGEFVDSLFDSMPDRFVQGINCEILLVDDLNYQIMTTDFQSIRKINIDRVSRHKAPEFLYQISYSNGRDVIVTPEHPVYTYTMAGISTIDASKLQPDAFVPGIRELNFNSCTTIFETNFTSGKKRLILPSQLNLSFSLFLGYCVSEGYSYKSSTHEVGLSNSDPVIISKMISCIRETFGIEPIDDTTRNKRIRIISKNVYEYLHHNFKELMMYSCLKRIPASIFSATDDYRIAFLSTAFEGDSLIEAESLCYRTTSKKLAGDYQDLLSTIDIQTRIIVENYLFDNGKQHLSRFKVYIRGDSLIQFVETVIPHYSDHSQVSYLLRRSSPRNCSRDVLPGQVAEIIIRIMKQLGLTYSGEFGRVQTQNQGITIILARKYLRKIRSRIKFICDNIDKTQDLKAIQHLLAYPQARVGSILQMKLATLGYKERKSISNQELVFDLKSHFKSIFDEVSKQVDSIEDLMSFQWVRVKKVEKIPNSGPGKINWVYDVTIEPTGNFISNNLILHNTVSIAKAGIVATLNSRTAVMAAANPKYGRYEPHRTFSENVNLSPAILSRFDLVFVLRDTPEPKEDTRMASHILKLHRLHGTAQSIKPPLTADQLKKYIAFAKSNYNPVLTEEAAEVLEEFYVTMRNTYGSSDDEGSRGRVTITARQLEGIIRLAEARARAALRNQVTKQDAVKAVELMKDSLSHTAIDPATGEADIDALFSPHTTARRSKLSTLVSLIDFLNKQYSGKPFPQETLLEEAEKEGLNRDYITGVIRQMLRDGALYQPKAGTLKKPDT